MHPSNPTLLALALLATLTSCTPIDIDARQVQRCNLDICTPIYVRCIKSCDSLTNADCFDVITGPQCEGCRVTLQGCRAEKSMPGEAGSPALRFFAEA